MRKSSKDEMILSYNDVVLRLSDLHTVRDFVEPLKLHSRNLVIFPVNNNDDVKLAEGGSHWSLLVFERNANMFVHHDSSKAAPQGSKTGMTAGYMSSQAEAIHDWYRDGGSHRKSLWFSVVTERVTPSSVLRIRGEISELIRGLMASC
ncbi:hypothetical protein MLD38_008317 [Melastoma candidum]|uniref:Uncharacterized protein n=1 Tax=Melastoma candidum TaxID=119954 RepID=A0ACB9RX12_9MYRT|nr:hypothetical protein MLD38_008317 [Melastoma candidum]